MFSPSAAIILFDVLGLLLAAALMVTLPFYRDHAKWIFWAGAACAGLNTASLYGTTFLWAGRYVEVDGRCVSVCCVGIASQLCQNSLKSTG